WTRVLSSGAGHVERPAFPDVQVPLDAARYRDVVGTCVVATGRTTRYAVRLVPAPLQPRRAAATPQRAEERHVACRTAPGAPRVRARVPSAHSGLHAEAPRPGRTYWTGTGQRPSRRQRSRAADTIRPVLHRQLVDLVRPADPWSHALAHPDEPQRALASAIGEPSAAAREAAAPAIPESRRAIGVVFALFALALAALLAGYLAVTIPGDWFSGAVPKVYDAKSLAVAVGTGSMDGITLAVAPADASGTIIVTVAVALSASDYRGVAWQASGLPPGTEARLLWHTP